MKNLIVSVASLSLFSFLIVATTLQSEELKHNPFMQKDAVFSEDKVIGAKSSGQVEKPDFTLRGLIISHNSMVNVDGEILAIGDELKGYRLVTINEDSAVFLRRGERFIIGLDEEVEGKPNE